MSKNRISIIGCGWLGNQLGTYLSHHHYQLIGTVQSNSQFTSLQSHQIQPAILSVSTTTISGDLSVLDTDTIIVLIPFKRTLQDPQDYTQQLRLLTQHIQQSPATTIIMASSTSAYPFQNQHATESDPLIPHSPRSNALLDAEQFFLDLYPSKQVYVLRLAGLCGPGRLPHNKLNTTRRIQNAHMRVNLIHIQDINAIIHSLIQTKPPAGLYNLVADLHPTRQEYYAHHAQKLGLKIPEFDHSNTPDKSVSNHKIKSALSYTFLFPDPFLF